jgi:hypothetical protein
MTFRATPAATAAAPIAMTAAVTTPTSAAMAAPLGVRRRSGQQPRRDWGRD